MAYNYLAMAPTGGAATAGTKSMDLAEPYAAAYSAVVAGMAKLNDALQAGGGALPGGSEVSAVIIGATARGALKIVGASGNYAAVEAFVVAIEAAPAFSTALSTALKRPLSAVDESVPIGAGLVAPLVKILKQAVLTAFPDIGPEVRRGDPRPSITLLKQVTPRRAAPHTHHVDGANNQNSTPPHPTSHLAPPPPGPRERRADGAAAGGQVP